jgi:anaerobic dimethyl sulfoxide reductase subunit B (iron-sulfur subunit)
MDRNALTHLLDRKEIRFSVENLKHTLLSRRKVLKAGVMATFALSVGISPVVIKAESTEGAPENPDQIGFMYDQEKCINCKSCAKACKETNIWEDGTQWRRVLANTNKHFLSISCNHCENPACAAVCPVVAYTKREKDGIVVHDREKCVGCKYCMYACPYHAPQFSDVNGRISKCHFCFERQDQGNQPACVAACPTKALTYGKLSQLRQTQSGVAQLEGLPNPELTKPSWVIIPKA